MSRVALFLLLAAALAVGAAFALGLVGGDGPGEGDGGGALLRGGERRADGPTGPLRTADDAASKNASLTGRMDAAPASTKRAPRLRSATVRVVDPSGLPVAGQRVTVYVGANQVHGTFTTDADGRIRITDLPVGADVFVRLGSHFGGVDDAGFVRLQGDSLELRAVNVMPLRVDVVDAETGAVLPGARWVFTTPDLRGGVNAIPSGGSTRIQANLGIELARPFAAETPPDYVDWDAKWSSVISRYATSVEARHPLRREATVTVQAIDEEKEDVRDAQVHAFHVAGRGDASPQTGAWMLGGTPLRGVPFFAGQTLRVWARTPGDLGGDATARLPTHDHEEVLVELVLRKDYRIENEEAPWGEERKETSWREPDPRLGQPDGPSGSLGSLEVSVLHADGRPAVGARVRGLLDGEQRTDETGVLRIEKLVAGEYPIRLDEPGLVPVSDTAEVVSGEVSRVTLQEPVGATLSVTVKAADGRPLPHAMVTVGQAGGTIWCDVAPDGTQRLDPYVDERGRRTLRRVQPGRIRLDGVWGGWKGTIVVTVGDRQTKDVTLLLR